MNDFKTLLLEAFNRPYKWKWEQTSPLQYTATFQDAEYTVFDVRVFLTRKVWTLDFGNLTGNMINYDNTGFRDAFRVLATVVDILKDFIRKVDPLTIQFVGDKAEGKEKLYSKMLKRFEPDLKKLGYRFAVISGSHSSDAYFLVTKIDQD